MKILYVGLHYDYGNSERGLCLEYKNMYQALESMEGVEVLFFGTDDHIKEFGRDGMNELLLKTVQEQKPDMVFFVLFTEELKKETVAAITKQTKTFNWFGDDHWRAPIYSRFWAPCFTFIGTTDSQALKVYASHGIKNVIKTQWAVNPLLYKPQDKSLDEGKYNITFFGQKYGIRGTYIEALKKAGLPAEGLGRGWGNISGASAKDMLDIYSFSKINLNFTETQYMTGKERLKLLGKFFVKKELGVYSSNFQFSIFNFQSQLQSMLGTQRRTIKARTFEVPACGGFLLTGRSDEDISQYYEPGKEVVVFENTDDLIEKSRYYVEHTVEREAIARAGYERTLKEHTYEQRFKQIFEKLL